jgi:hypothetical protein
LVEVHVVAIDSDRLTLSHADDCDERDEGLVGVGSVRGR